MPYVPTGEQGAILRHDHHRHARVLAGPGTGKSATLVAPVDHLLEGNPAPRIELLTFTRAATAELAKKVSEHPAAAAERPSAIHSFSISVLLRNPGTGDLPERLRIADKWEDRSCISRYCYLICDWSHMALGCISRYLLPPCAGQTSWNSF
jgi:superfamily I DNA/RNA helicase